VVAYGIDLLKPAIFYAAVALICAIVGSVTGSSWTTAGTLGVAFMGMAPILGVSTTIAAGAIISGGYLGDKMSPLSWTTVPAFALALLVYLGLGLTQDVSGAVDTQVARDALDAVYRIGPVCLLPIALLVVLALKKVPPFLSIFSTALFTGVLASFLQPDVVRAFVDKPGQGAVLNGVEAIFKSM